MDAMSAAHESPAMHAMPCHYMHKRRRDSLRGGCHSQSASDSRAGRSLKSGIGAALISTLFSLISHPADLEEDCRSFLPLPSLTKRSTTRKVHIITMAATCDMVCAPMPIGQMKKDNRTDLSSASLLSYRDCDAMTSTAHADALPAAMFLVDEKAMRESVPDPHSEFAISRKSSESSVASTSSIASQISRKARKGTSALGKYLKSAALDACQGMTYYAWAVPPAPMSPADYRY